MAFDLEGFSAKDLDSLIKQANKRKTALTRRTPVAQVRRKLAALAKAEGYTISELFGNAVAKGAARKAAKGRKAGKVAPKYRNPAKPGETWSGRGLPPRWMAAQLKKGRKREDFLIRK